MPAVIPCTLIRIRKKKKNAMSRNVCKHTFTTPSLTSFYHFILHMLFACVCVCLYAFLASSCHRYIYEFCVVRAHTAIGQWLLLLLPLSLHCITAVIVVFVAVAVVVVVVVVIDNRLYVETFIFGTINPFGTCSTRLPSQMAISISTTKKESI